MPIDQYGVPSYDELVVAVNRSKMQSDAVVPPDGRRIRLCAPGRNGLRPAAPCGGARGDAQGRRQRLPEGARAQRAGDAAPAATSSLSTSRRGHGSAPGCTPRSCSPRPDASRSSRRPDKYTFCVTSSLKGQLLIAAPTLVDPNFRRTVVLLLEHTEEGALGVVLNRPSETEARDAVPDLDTCWRMTSRSTWAGRCSRDGDRAGGVRRRRRRGGARDRLGAGSIEPATTPPSWDRASSAPASSPATPAGRKGSWRGRSTRRPGSPSPRCRRTSSPTSRAAVGERAGTDGQRVPPARPDARKPELELRWVWRPLRSPGWPWDS